MRRFKLMQLNTRQQKVVESTKPKILCLATAGSGKALPNSSKIFTTDGWKTVGEIKKGDYLFDRNGLPTKVLEVFPQGKKQVYELYFKDGRTARSSIDHIWNVHKKTWKNRTEFRNYTLKEILDDKLCDNQGSLNWSIPCSKQIVLPEKQYDIDPYVIGCFLGDGSCTVDDLTISSDDEELVAEIARLIGAKKYHRNYKNYDWRFECEPYINDVNILVNYIKTKVFFKNYLEELGQYSYNKKIPDAYKYGSIEQRYNLLQGLFDTDGSICEAGGRFHVSFSSTSYQLILDVKEVLGTLGYFCSIREDKRPEKYTKSCYQLIVNMPNDEKFKLFRLSRKVEIAKKAIGKKQNRVYTRTLIKDIKKLDYEEDMTCFLVDNEEHLFLTDEFVVTHNTRALTERIRYLIEVRKVRPQDIVAFSFTNMAAEEIKKRLGDMANGAYIGTIHGYANRILVSNGFDTINYIQNQLFDKILEKALTVSKSKLPKIVHLLIDEAQDLSPLEYHFIERLPTKNIAFFGDELQMIYKFRGSSIAYIEDMFLNTEFEKYYLIEDYRNPPDILSFAQEFTNNCTKFRPKGVAVKKENGYIEKCSFPSALEVLEEDGDWGNWFILTRTNAELAEAQQLLKEREIPNITFKKGDLELNQLEELMLSNNVKVLTIHTCMSADTLVPTQKGIMTIEQIVKESDKSNYVYNGTYYDKVNDFIDNGIAKTYKITTNHGNFIRLTENHDVIVLTKNGLQKKKVCDLEGGENVLLRKDIKNYKSKPVELKQINKEDLHYNTIYYDTPSILDENLAELVGMITADGSRNELSIHYAKRYKECVDRFAELIYKCFNKEIIVKKSSYEDAWLAECNSKHILKFLYENFNGIENNEKFISDKILQASQKIQCAFLRGLFEDGSVKEKKDTIDNITLTFKNPAMLNQLQTLLFSLGIDASFATRQYKEKNPLNYCHIYSTGMTVFKEKINFISKIKQDRINSFEQKYQRKNKSSIFKEIFLEHKDELYVVGQSKFWNNLKGNLALTDGAFFTYYELLNEKQKSLDYIKLIKDVFENYLVEEISEIKYYGEEPTYCLTMEHENQFIQNGFLMGNCKGLQAPNVIVVGARTYCEEERLIAFVAATRAEEQLFWCPSYKAKSRFKKRSESTCVGQLFKGDQDVIAF